MSNFNIIEWNGTYYGEAQINNGTFYTQTGQGQHSAVSDPIFVNPVLDNYHLQSISPAIDAGTSADSAAIVDIEGNSRCDDLNTPNAGSGTYPFYYIGAYEYQCSLSTKISSPPARLAVLNQ